MKRQYVAYIRAANKDDYEVEKQKQYIDNFANRKNIKIDYYYIDNGYSGINLDRPQLRQLLRDVKSKKVTKGIIVKDLARLSRDQSGICEIIKRISKRQVELVSTIDKEIIDSNVLDLIMQIQREDGLKRRKMAQKFYEERKEVEKYEKI